METLLERLSTWPLRDVIIKYLTSITTSVNIVVVGAYEGTVMQYLIEQCIENDVYIRNIIGYEPQQWAVEAARRKLHPYIDLISWDVAPCGLATVSGSLPMNEFGTDAASLVRSRLRPNHEGTITVVEAVDELSKVIKMYGTIDLMVMNIEGYEYQLLPHISRLLPDISALAVQFHTDLPSVSETDYANSLYLLDTTYIQTFHHFLPSWGFWHN